MGNEKRFHRLLVWLPLIALCGLITLIALPLFAFGYVDAILHGPKTILSASSPDGRYIAYVEESPSIDPPNQSLLVDLKHALYRSQIPTSLLSEPALASPGATGQAERLSIRIRCPESTGFVEIDVRDPGDPRDPVLYVHMADTANGQLEVLLLQINAPHTPRFDIDRDWRGESTKLGTLTRNVPAEVAAIEAGRPPDRSGVDCG